MKFQLSATLIFAALVTTLAVSSASEGHVRLRGERGGLHDAALEPESAAPASDYNQETTIDHDIPGAEHVSLTVETLFAFVYISLIACVPLILRCFEEDKESSKVSMIQGVALFIWLVGGVYLFTNVLLFQSSHFDTIRSLSLVETIYLISQIITTVGYGDITPAKPRGQVFVGIFVVLSILLIADMVSGVTQIILEHGKQAAVTISRRTSSSFGTESISVGPMPTDEVAESAEEEDKIEYGPLVAWSVVFVALVIVGVLFWHLYPGEEKTLVQAVYMSIITLSTVGFGALTATTEMGKAFSAFWMLFGVAALGGVVGSFTDVMIAAKNQERRLNKVNQEEFAGMARDLGILQEGQALEAVAQTRVDKSMLLQFELLRTGKVPLDLLLAMEDAFAKLEPNANGNVSYEQVEALWTKAKK